jgi:hypothetical protein
MTTWASIGEDSHLVVADLTTEDPAGRFAPTIPWVVVPEALAADPAALQAGLSLAADGVTVQITSSVAYAAAQKAQIEARRYAAETGGISVAGVAVLTSRDSQAMIAGATAAAKDGVIASFNFKAATGWVTLTADQVIAIGRAVATHVQTCFSAGMRADAAIDAALASSPDPATQVTAIKAAAVF